MSLSSDEVERLLASSDVWDMTLPWTLGQQDLSLLARYKRAGFTFVSATTQDIPASFSGITSCIESCQRLIRAAPEWLVFAKSVADIEAARQEGKLAVGLNVQDTLQLGTDLTNIQALQQVGVRHMLLAYQTRNFVADGCAETSDAGLSNFGRLVVREMNRVGMIIDCTHTGRRSSLEAIELSERPPIFSHSNAYSVCAHIRNITDEQIRHCAARGGVVGVVGVGAFLGDPQASAESMFRHIDYIATLVGAEHVGIGTDYMNDMPAAFKWMLTQKETAWPDPTGTQLYEGTCFQPEQLRDLVQIMLSNGYSSDVVRGILGRNFKRVYQTLGTADGSTRQ
jgi:membrane dipeptidase